MSAVTVHAVELGKLGLSHDSDGDMIMMTTMTDATLKVDGGRKE